MTQLREEILRSLEQQDLQGAVDRVARLIEREESPGALPLGIFLALSIAREMQQGKDPGSETRVLVSRWTELLGETRVEEAVQFARSFLLQPKNLVEKIRERLRGSGE